MSRSPVTASACRQAIRHSSSARRSLTPALLASQGRIMGVFIFISLDQQCRRVSSRD
jgi:hypothetical protein